MTLPRSEAWPAGGVAELRRLETADLERRCAQARVDGDIILVWHIEALQLERDRARAGQPKTETETGGHPATEGATRSPPTTTDQSASEADDSECDPTCESHDQNHEDDDHD